MQCNDVENTGWSNVPMLWQTLVLGYKWLQSGIPYKKKDNYDLFIALYTASSLPPPPPQKKSLLHNYEQIWCI